MFGKPQKALHLYIDEEKKSPKHVGVTYAVLEKFDGWYMYVDFVDGAWGEIKSRAGRTIPSVQHLNIFKQLDEITPAHAILASNTSSLSITEIAAATNRPNQVVGLHFFNPVPVMKLIEINIGLTTDEATVAAMREVGESLNKTLVEVKDAPGFVVNRILIPMINEAIIVLNEGISTAAEIDEAMKAGANHPMGPLALADLIGLDTVLAIMNVLYEGYSDSKYRPAQLLKKKVEAGHLGRKTGQGFFEY